MFCAAHRARVLTAAPTVDDGPEKMSGPAYTGDGPHWIMDRKQSIPVKYAAEGIASEAGCKAQTLQDLYAEVVKKHPHKVALRVERDGLEPLAAGSRKAPPAMPMDMWQSWTWKQFYDEILVAGRAFIALGMERYDGVNIYGFNSPEWLIGDLACIFAGGISAGIYPSDTPDQVEYKCFHSDSSIAVVEGKKQAKIFMDAAARLPKLKAIITWDPNETEALPDYTVPSEEGEEGKPRVVKCLHWSDLKTEAEKVPESELQERMDEQTPGQPCAYIYTSGTTGRPKAVMISHDNIVFESFNVLELIPHVGGMVEEEERIISFLPLSHVAGMMVDIVAPVALTAKGPGWACVHFARPYDLKLGSMGDRLKAVKPTLFLGVPRVWEKSAEKIMAIGAKTKGLVKMISKWGKGKGLEFQANCQMGGSGRQPAFYGMAESIVHNKVKAAMGLECCKFGFTGAAPITKDTLEYFGSLGIQINEVYGMSECTGATTWSTEEAHVWGSCGWPMPGNEVKICKPSEDGNSFVDCPHAEDIFSPTEECQGEICFRGRHIMLGYMANPALGEEHMEEIRKKNAEAIDSEGWLHSGDKGCMDARGMVKITGRYKELIITAGGENIAPVPIEDNIKKLCPAISNIVMIGDKRKFNVAVVTLKAKGAEGEDPGTDELTGAALDLCEGITTISAATENDTVIEIIQAAVDATNKDGEVCISNAAKIQKWTILPHDFSVKTGELTPTLKTKRAVVMTNFHDAIEAMYNSKEKYVKYAATSEKAAV